MSLPKVAIVGRPNVGKSSLLNCLAGRRISIVDPTPGVTRDRVSARVRADDRTFVVIDTGGMGMDDPDFLTDKVEAQIWAAIHEADLLLFIVDAREGITPHDREALNSVRASGKPILLVANKAELGRSETDAAEFFALGLGEPYLISALERTGIRDLTSAILDRLPPAVADSDLPCVRVAIVGKRNVGKSTLVNTLAGEERTIVSEIPGTTRDAIDVELRRGDRTFVLIDTAGVRKKGKVDDSIEFYGMVRSTEALLRCDVVLLMTAAEMEVSEVDKKLAALIAAHAKPCLIVVNKWDLVRAQEVKHARDKYLRYLRDEKLPNLAFAPVEFTTATHPKAASRIFARIWDLHEEACRRVPTAELNEEIHKAAVERTPSTSGKAPKIYYATQVSASPPAFVLFVNRPAMFDKNYGRFIAGRIRSTFGFDHIPVKVMFRPHRRSDEDREK